MVGYQVTVGNDIPNFSRCRNLDSLQNLMNDNYSEPKFQLGVIHVVQLILKNMSYEQGALMPQCIDIHTRDKPLFTKILVNIKVEYFPSRDEYAAIKLSDEDNALTFLACGKSKPRQFSFNELVSVFEIEIWVSISISMVLLTIVTAVVNDIPIDMKRNLKILNSLRLDKLVSVFVQVTKALLEQGDPFSSTIAGKHRFRFNIGTFLLVGIVISNAYKSSNVYNLVLPRKPVPYENVSQLFDARFKIYSRGSFFDNHMMSIGDVYINEKKHWKYLKSLNYSQFLKIDNLGREPFRYGYSELKQKTSFPFGPAVSGLYYLIFLFSEVSLMFLKLFYDEAAIYR